MHGQLNKNNGGVKLALWTLASLLSIMMQSYKCSHRFSSKIPTLTYNCVNSNILPEHLSSPLGLSGVRSLHIVLNK